MLARIGIILKKNQCAGRKIIVGTVKRSDPIVIYRILMIYEEPKGARMHDNWNQLQQMITRRKMQIRPMFGEKYMQNSFERYIFMTNE